MIYRHTDEFETVVSELASKGTETCSFQIPSSGVLCVLELTR